MPDMITFQRLILADQTILENCECGYADKNLWCYLKGLTFVEAFQAFSDPSAFATVIFEYGLLENYRRITYSGLEEIRSISQREFTVDVQLVGTNVTIHEETITPIAEQEGDDTDAGAIHDTSEV